METRHRILVIDDNSAIHDDFRKILLTRGTPSTADTLASDLFDDVEAPRVDGDLFEIDSAWQGPEGIAKVGQALAEDRPYALAYVDGRMPPGCDGVETITRLWQTQPDLQVVLCSAYSDHSWADILRKLGESDSLFILRKPFEPIEVLQLTHALTRKWWVGRDLRRRIEELERQAGASVAA
jgi:CheY-like chemotaxis protein